MKRNFDGFSIDSTRSITIVNNQSHLHKLCQTAVSLFFPIIICISFVVVIYFNVIYYLDRENQLYLSQNIEIEETISSSWLEIFQNVFAFLLTIIIATFILFLLFKYKFYKLIFYWLSISTVILLIFFLTETFRNIFIKFEITLDLITLIFFVYNNTVLGMISIFKTKTVPKIINQFYLILISILVSLKILKVFSGFNCWIILIAISIWDLFAVLFKNGPINLILNVAKERNIPIMPALIYSTIMVNDKKIDTTIYPSSDSITLKDQSKLNQNDKNDSIKLGLGDFIFYSVLIAKTSQINNWFITLSCALSIMIGLILTLTLLLILKKPMPALPVSIIISIFVYVLAYQFIINFQQEVIINNLFI